MSHKNKMMTIEETRKWAKKIADDVNKEFGLGEKIEKEKSNKYIYYKPLEIRTEFVSGIVFAMKAMRKPKGTEHLSDSKYIYGTESLGESDSKLAGRLIRAGNDHAKAMRGVIVWAELKMQTGFMIEFETYRHGVECLSTSSSMHRELKELSGPELADKKQNDLSHKVYNRSVCMSYQALRSMYRARKNHRHPDWRIFCQWVETLPYFDKLIYPEFKEN